MGMYRLRRKVYTESWLLEKNSLQYQGIKPASLACQSNALPTELHPHPNLHSFISFAWSVTVTATVYSIEDIQKLHAYCVWWLLPKAQLVVFTCRRWTPLCLHRWDPVCWVVLAWLLTSVRWPLRQHRISTWPLMLSLLPVLPLPVLVAPDRPGQWKLWLDRNVCSVHLFASLWCSRLRWGSFVCGGFFLCVFFCVFLYTWLKVAAAWPGCKKKKKT